MAEDDKHEPTCCEKFGTGLSNFFKFLYNNETGQVMGRSGVSWAKIGFFYLIFYGFLAGFFSGMLAVFLSTLEDPEKGGAPKLTQYVANQPGLSRLDERLGKALQFNYNKNDTVLVSNYSTMIRGFLDKYSGPLYKDKPACSTNQTAEAGMGKDLCCYNTTEFLGKCNGVQDPYFGLTEEKPCYFIRMNKVYNWVPSNDGSGFLKLECKDRNNNQVPEVIPKGFLINAFPFRGQDGFELPVVAVKIDVKKKPAEIDCVLVGKDIEVSTSFVPSRAYGNIRIK